jgi:segregation and condensation protein A
MVAAGFTVDLSTYAGPLDLLLYLVKRDELDLDQVSLSRITHQYIEFLEIIENIDVDASADFLEPVGILLEMKARHVIPTPTIEEEVDEVLSDPAEQLVQRLVQYKRYRDVAAILDERSRTWQLRYGRQADDRPLRKVEPIQRSLAKIEIWDLVSAFGRILRERKPAPETHVFCDETPIHEYMQSIHREIHQQGRIELQSLFKPGRHKSSLVALFLASLELTRHHGVIAEQDGYDGPIWLVAGDEFSENLTIAEVGNLDRDQVALSNLPMRPR